MTLREDRGVAEMEGLGYAARLSREGVRVRATAGDDRARLTYRLARVEAGDTVLFDRASADLARPQVAGTTVTFSRGPGFEETYEGRESGIEQIFKIADPLPRGADLRIRGSFESPLERERVAGRGVLFKLGGKELLSYGEPTVIDARGRIVPGQLSIEGDSLCLAFPADRLEGLEYPIVVDPLIGSNFLAGSITISPTIRPNSTLAISGSWTTVGAATREAAVSDSSDSSYVTTTHNTGTRWIRFGCGTFAKPPGAVVTSVVVGFRHFTSSATKPTNRAVIKINNVTQYTTASYTTSGGIVTREETWNSGDLTQAQVDGLEVVVESTVTPGLPTFTTRFYEAYLRVNYFVTDREAAVAWNSVRNEYLVVYELQVGANDTDIWGSRVSATGSLIGSSFAIRNQAGVHERNPDVAYSPTTDRYAIAFEYADGDVALATIGWDGTYVGAWYIDNRRPPTGYSRDPKIVRQTGDGFLIVWSDSDASVPQNQWILCERVDSNAAFVSPTTDDWQIQATTGTTALRRPSATYNSAQNNFYFAWEHTDGSARSVAVTGDLAFYVGPWPNVTLSASGHEPAVTWNSVRNEYQAVWSDNVLIGGDYDLFLQRVFSSGTKVGEKAGGIRIIDASLNDQKAPALVFSAMADESLVVYTEAFSPTDRDIYAQPIRSHGIAGGSFLTVNAGTYETLQPALASGQTNGRFLAAWEDRRNATWDVYAQQITDTAPRILETDPPHSANRVPTDYSAKVFFSDAMFASTINTTNCRIIDTVTSLPVSASVSYNSAERSVLIDPTSALVASRNHQIKITTAVQDTSSNGLPAQFTADFTTGAGPALVDADGDGLLDLEEQLLGTSATNADTDGDGLNDMTEFSNNIDPLDTDTDNDGTSDYTELVINLTNPRDPTSGGVLGHDPIAPRVISFSPAGGMTGQELNTNVYVQFSEPIDTATVVYGTSLKVENTSIVPATLIVGAITYQNGNRALKFDPTSDLPASSNIQITVPGGAGMIADPAGNVIAGTKLSSFTTVAAPGGGAGGLSEALHHPSFGEGTGAGQMSLRFGDGNVEDPSIACPYPPLGFTPGFVMVCGDCDDECELPQDVDIRCTGVEETFGGERSVVGLHNGAFVHGRVDWAYPDRSLHSVAFIRTYRSNLVDPGTQNPYLGLFGYRTVSNWETALVGYAGAGSNFTFRTPDGRHYTMTWNETSWSLPAGFYGRWHLDTPNSELRLIFRNGLMYAYRTSDGKLKYVRDRNGQKQTLNYAGSQLSSITDATGRVTTFGYNGNGRISTITFFDNLVLTYAYDVSQDLRSVTFPGTDEFPSGRNEQMTYTGTHLLRMLVNGRGQTTLTNNYSAAGLVESQDHIAGTLFYIYDFDNPTGILTTVIDRMGNISDVLHESNGAPKAITQYSRGANELDPTSQWVTAFTHDSNGEITKVVHPRGNVTKFGRGTNGHMIERRRKTADVADDDSVDIVEKWKIDSQFGCVLRYMEPRANVPGFPAADKVALTRFYFYDHEDTLLRLELEANEMGAAVGIAGSAEQTYGRTGAGQFPAKDTAVYGDNDGDALGDRGGNLWIGIGPAPKVVNPSNPSQFEAARQVIEDFFSYNQPGQLLIHRDPLGNRRRLQYYSGTFNLSTYPNAGFVLYKIVDSGLTSANLNLATGDPSGASEPSGRLALTTTFAYDARGNKTEIRSPRGFGRSDSIFKTAMTYDANNLLRTRTLSAPFSYQWSFFYDGNMKLVEERTPNVLPNDLNGNGIQDGASEQTTQAPAYFRTTFTYCACNDVLSRTVDASGLALTTAFEYDLNQKRVYERDPHGNTRTFVFDERDLLIRVTLGVNDSSVAAKTRYVHDANGNQTKVHDDDLDVDPADTPTVSTFDLFDRPTKVTDELGNESERVYDRASFVRQQIFRGPDSQGGANEILAQAFTEYDEAGRVFQIDRDHFDAVANVALADGALVPPISNVALARGSLNSTVMVFDAGGRVTKTIDDNLHGSSTTFDAANRPVVVTSPNGSSRTVRYDRDGNAIDVREVETADVGANPAFVSRTFVDELGRAIVTVSPLGNTSRRLYDSRGNVVQVADAQADNAGNASALDAHAEHLFDATYPDVAVSGRGNRGRQTYDGAGRLTLTERDLTSDGSGNGTVIKTIRTTNGYDRASRLISQTDDNDNKTEYFFDALNRRSAIKNADATVKWFFYDRTSNLRKVRDERNVASTFLVDKLGRRVETTIENLPPGPGQTTFELFQYDGRSRLTRGENNHSILALRYDSHGPVIREDQTINVGTDRLLKTDPLTSVVQKVVTSSYDGEGNRTQLVYPSGTVVNETYDLNDRLKLVKDGSTTLAEYVYVGNGPRVLEKRLPQGLVTLYRSYDGDRRVTRHDQRRTTDGMRIAGYTYAWDRVGNRWYERTLTNNTNPSETAGTGEAFAYDSAYRMLDYFEGVTSGTLDLIQNNSPRPGASLSYATLRRYELDGVGNRTETRANGVVDNVYRLDGDDQKTNQYTFVNDTFQSYDKAGNLLSEGTWAYSFTARNQLTRAESGATDALYRYDALGRRVSKRMASGNFPGWSHGHAVYICAGDRILEEHDTAGTRRKTWIFGCGIDEPLRQAAPDYSDVDFDGNTTEDAVLFYLTNARRSIVALGDGSGVARERYVSDVWGTIRDVIDKNGAGSGASWTLVGNPWTFTGRQYEFEERSNRYHYRARAYHPSAGQFAQRDPVPSFSYPNARAYVSHNPSNRSDPSGLETEVILDDVPDESVKNGFLDFVFNVDFRDEPDTDILVQRVFLVYELYHDDGRLLLTQFATYAEWFRLESGSLPQTATFYGPDAEGNELKVAAGRDTHSWQTFMEPACTEYRISGMMLVGPGTILNREGNEELSTPDVDFGYFQGGQTAGTNNAAFSPNRMNYDYYRRTGAEHQWGYLYRGDSDTKRESISIYGLTVGTYRAP